MSAASIQLPTPPDDETSIPCVLVFNATDPSGYAGIAADILTTGSVGTHGLPITTGAYVRDSTQIFDHFALDDEAVSEQARTVLEDIPIQAIKVGFAGSPENISAIAELASDYADVPLLTYMPDLSWWHEDRIDQYHDACKELLLPQTTVLIGSHGTLVRWLLPQWSAQHAPSARDIAQAASELGVSYTLVTGIALPDQYIDNVLASSSAILYSHKHERFDAVFSGAGETLSAALTALIACEVEITQAVEESLTYLDHCLENGHRPGMGHVLPDRLFWAESDDDDDEDPASSVHFDIAPSDTRH